ncbi:MAG: hypothetical protein WCY88_14570 [Spongiibacteraceae bacterium]
MSFIITTAKVIATILLLIFLFVGILKSSPRSHNPKYPPMAEYLAGFIIFFSSLLGLYYLWLD